MKAKKILSLAVAVIMLVCMFNTAIIAEKSASDTTKNITLGTKYVSEDTVYNLSDGDTLTITGQVKVQDGATLTINGGNIVINNFNSDWVFYAGGGKIIFNNVNFVATSIKKYVIQADWGNSITFNNSVLTLTDVYCLFYTDPYAGDGILNLNNTKIYLKSGCNRVAQGTKAFVNLSNNSLIYADSLKEHAFRNVEIIIDNSKIDINGCETGVKNDDGSKVAISGSSSFSVKDATASLAINLSNGSKMFATKDSSITVDGEDYTEFTLTVTAVAKVGNTSYETLEEALKAMSAENSELTLLTDITVTKDWDCRYSGSTFNFPATINGNGHTIKFTGKINDGYNYLTVFRPNAAATFKDLTVDMSEATAVFQNRFSVISSYDADLTVENCTFIGSKTYKNSRAIIFGEGAQHNNANIIVTGCTFIDWKYGVTDNLNGKDVAAVKIADSNFNDASINVSAAEEVVITANEVNGGYIKVASYTNLNNNKVTVLDNIIDEAFVDDNVIYCDGTLNVQEGFVIPMPELPTATVTDISKEELAAANAPELTFAKKFVADDADEKVVDYYDEWYADFVLTLNKTAIFNANGGADGYLAGQYTAWSENWVSVPFDDVTLEAGKPLKIMEYAAELMGESGLKITYNDVLNFVKEFNCGIHFNDEYLAANPDLKVTLELRIYNNKNEEESYSIGDNYEFEAPELPTGTLTRAYTSENTYWGECGGNAKESFEFKFYNDNTYMGYTSLNNIDGIIDGNVYVSWHIKLDAESNTDEYWDMAWEINPTIDMQPNRVEQWVDGVKVGECLIEPTWADDLSPVIAAVTEENGKILSYVNNRAGHTLADAFANGGKVVLLDNIKVDYALTVKEDMTLDLNGHTITATDKMASGSFNLISISKGKHLTVNDSVGTGEINLIAITNRNWNAQSTIFENRGSQLTINGGNFKHLGGTDMAFVVNVNANSFGDAVLTVNGGSLESSYTSIRLYMDSPESNAGSGTAFVNVAGGTIDGNTSAIWAQSPKDVAGQTGKINVTDGTVGSINTARSAASIVETIISGGTVSNLKVEEGELKITGGTVTGDIIVLDENGNVVENDDVITGGTFINDVSAFVADGYELVENEDGTYGVEIAVKNVFGGKFAIINNVTEDGYYRVAFVSGIDSLNYKEVGFIFYCDGEKVTSVSTKKVYSSLTVTSTSGVVQTITAEDIGAYRMFYQGVKFNPEKWDDVPIEYQPYAITLDGETILGTISVLDDIYTLDG